MESNAFRAMTIGAGVLLAIATISMVILYYNTAKEGMGALGRGTDLSNNYNKHILDILTKEEANGIDVINLLNYFEDNHSVDIKFFKGKNTDADREYIEVKKENIKPNERFIIKTDTSYTNIKIRVID